MIRKLIEEIIEKYYRESDKYYADFRYDGDDEIWMKDELSSALTEKGVIFKIETEEGISLTSYNNDFLAVSWIEADGTLGLITVVTELM